MARHVANGGNPYDTIGEHIVGLSEEMGQLKKFKGYVSRNEAISEAMGDIASKVFERMDQVRKEIQGLQSQKYYESFAESFEAHEAQDIPEDLMNDWIDRLTIRTFNEELKSVFPYIYKLVGESQRVISLSPEDLLVAEDTVGQETIGADLAEIGEFEDTLDTITDGSGILSDNDAVRDAAIQKLNDLIQDELPVGTDGTNAIESLQDIIDDDELSDIFKELADIGAETDARPIIKDYIQIKDEENGTDVLSQLNFGGESPAEEPAPVEEPAPAAPAAPAVDPAAAPPAAPAPAPAAAPVMASLEPTGTPFVEAVRRAAAAGMKLEDTFTVKGKTMSLKSALESIGINPDSFFSNKADELHEYVESMFNKEEGTFPKGETGVLMAVEKKFGEGAIPHAQNIFRI